MFIRIFSIDKEIYSGDADSLTLPSADGQITVLKNHLPIISLLKSGKITVRNKDKKDFEYHIKNGFTEINTEMITVLAE